MLRSSKQGKQEMEPKESEHYCYICVKKYDSDRIAEQNWPAVIEEILKEESEDQLDEDCLDYLEYRLNDAEETTPVMKKMMMMVIRMGEKNKTRTSRKTPRTCMTTRSS